MDARELKIGNYIYKEGKIHQVDGIDFGLARREAEYNIKIFKPIPLSEEWLMKFGFENEIPTHWDKGILYFQEINNLFEFWLDGNTIVLEFVHQLQNLFYALSGEELIIKE